MGAENGVLVPSQVASHLKAHLGWRRIGGGGCIS